MHSRLPKDIKSAVLLLHGLGANGADLIGLADAFAPLLPNTAFFSPDAIEPCDMAPFGFQWFSLRNWTTASITEGLKKARPAVDQIIDQLLKEYHLAPSSFVLAGFSQGTMLSLYAGLQREKPLAGILGYSGALTGLDKPVSAPPVLLVHGLEDTVVPAAGSRQAADFLKKHGVPVDLHFIPRLGHGIDGEGLDLGAKFLQRVLKGSEVPRL